MKVIKKVNLNLLLTLCVVCISMLQPITARAADKVPGGANNTVVFTSVQLNKGSAGGIAYDTRVISFTVRMKNDYELVAFLDDDYINQINVAFLVSKNGEYFSLGYKKEDSIDDYVVTTTFYNNGELVKTEIPSSLPSVNTYYRSKDGDTVTSTLSGCKLFKSEADMKVYVSDGSLDGMVKDELDKMWYLENVGYKVDADDSPTSEAGEDATYITFTWDTDNLQDGDLLEIKTHNYLKKIGGDQISGFHDYITHWNNVSAYTGKYRFSQYDATKAWFSTLDNKPLIFKSYDTDIYYLRPYRNGVYGGWVKITIGRSPLIKGSPYVEDIEYGDFDEDDEWVTDEELTEKNGGHHGVDQNGNITYPDIDNPFEGTNVTGIFKWFFDFMKEIPSFLGDLPSLVGSIIGFLPPQIIGFIALGVVVAIILRIVGR